MVEYLLRQYGIVTVHAGEDECLLIYFTDGIILAVTSKQLKYLCYPVDNTCKGNEFKKSAGLYYR